MRSLKIISPIKLLFLILIFSGANNAFALPPGFVYLDEIDPTIKQDIRYYGNENFVGRKIKGYNKPRAILTIEAANALKNVQAELNKDNYSLVIYDAYRPQKAVQDFITWSEDLADLKMKGKYYPKIDKSKFFELGYVAEKSSHSRGSTVDLTIIELGKNLKKDVQVKARKLQDGREVPYLEDNTVDMYTSFDLMDEASNHDTKLIPIEYLKKRDYLRSVMQRHNFNAYPLEWWHYTLNNEPYNKDQFFDFDIE